MSIQRYDIKRYGGVDLDDALVPYLYGGVVKTSDHEARVRALEEALEEALNGPTGDEIAFLGISTDWNPRLMIEEYAKSLRIRDKVRAALQGTQGAKAERKEQ